MKIIVEETATSAKERLMLIYLDKTGTWVEYNLQNTIKTTTKFGTLESLHFSLDIPLWTSSIRLASTDDGTVLQDVRLYGHNQFPRNALYAAERPVAGNSPLDTEPSQQQAETTNSLSKTTESQEKVNETPNSSTSTMASDLSTPKAPQENANLPAIAYNVDPKDPTQSEGDIITIAVSLSESNSTSPDSDNSTDNNDAIVLFNEEITDLAGMPLKLKRDKNQVADAKNDLSLNNTECGTKPEAGPHERQKRVVQGRQNTPNEWPWLVSLHYFPENDFTQRSGYKHVCGASLISPGWLMSAAHCFKNKVMNGVENLTNWEVYIGLHDQGMKDAESVEVRNISMVISHSDHDVVDSPFKADIALIKLDRPVEFTSSISPICIDDTQISYNKGMCYVTGWGQQSFEGKGTRFPFTSPLSLMTLKECKAKYELVPDDHYFKPFVYVDDPVICGYGQTGEDACLGDSGGPLMCRVEEKWLLTGIVSGGYECGHESFPGLYVRVSYYWDWIQDIFALYGDPWL